MKIVVDGRDLGTLVEKRNELKGLELVIVNFCEMDETKIEELRPIVNSLEVEKFGNLMQMITYMKLQSLSNKSAFYTTDHTVMFLLDNRTKNYCNDLSLTCRFVKGMNRFEMQQSVKKLMSTENSKVKGLA